LISQTFPAAAITGTKIHRINGEGTQVRTGMVALTINLYQGKSAAGRSSPRPTTAYQRKLFVHKLVRAPTSSGKIDSARLQKGGRQCWYVSCRRQRQPRRTRTTLCQTYRIFNISGQQSEDITGNDTAPTSARPMTLGRHHNTIYRRAVHLLSSNGSVVVDPGDCTLRASQRPAIPTNVGTGSTR